MTAWRRRVVGRGKVAGKVGVGKPRRRSRASDASPSSTSAARVERVERQLVGAQKLRSAIEALAAGSRVVLAKLEVARGVRGGLLEPEAVRELESTIVQAVTVFVGLRNDSGRMVRRDKYVVEVPVGSSPVTAWIDIANGGKTLSVPVEVAPGLRRSTHWVFLDPDSPEVAGG